MRSYLQVKKMRGVFIFYRHNKAVAVLFTILCCVLYARGGDIVAQVVTKLLTDGAYLFFLFSMGRDRLYYYYNLHLGRGLLVWSFLLTDLLLFGAGILLTHFLMNLWSGV